MRSARPGPSLWADMHKLATAPSEALAPYPNGGPNGIAVSPDGSTFVWWPKNSAPYYSLLEDRTYMVTFGVSFH